MEPTSAKSRLSPLAQAIAYLINLAEQEKTVASQVVEAQDATVDITLPEQAEQPGVYHDDDKK